MALMLRALAVTVTLFVSAAPAAGRSSSPTFAILSMTSTDLRHVWVLGLPCPQQPNCSQLAIRGSSDGGWDWPYHYAVPARANFASKGSQRAYVDRLQLATVRDAYAFGPSLLTSHDGGKTWTWQRQIQSVEALAPVGSEVWTVSDLCARAGACPVHLYRSPVGHDAWRRSALPLRSPAGSVQIVGAPNGHAWVLAEQIGSGAQMFKSVLLTSTNGVAWTRLPDPCSPAESYTDRLATRDGSHLWLVCGGQPGAGGELFSLYRSADGGRHWRIVASNEKKPHVPDFIYGGYVDSLAVTGPKTAWFSLDRGTLYTTHDGGRTWRRGIHQTVSDSTVGPVLFADRRHGWLASYPNVVFRTDNAGRTWQRISL